MKQLGRMDLGHQIVEINCGVCAWHRCAPTIYGRSMLDARIDSARWTNAPQAGQRGTISLGAAPVYRSQTAADGLRTRDSAAILSLPLNDFVIARLKGQPGREASRPD